ncbi:hypothetical protein ATHL_00693, partial [Anaerolinea thermolimosa]|uniref:phosphoribosyltransferase n=1 Tax=Anaerolinea thermolimosa TaxID=229919 RepID=UPI000B2E3F0F
DRLLPPTVKTFFGLGQLPALARLTRTHVIIDSGRTLSHVLELLSIRHPRSLKVCALLDKSERREVAVPVDYIGFQIPNKFVFGYGLDIDDYYRNLPFIGVVDLKRYHGSNSD